MLAPPSAVWEAPKGNAWWGCRRAVESPHVCVIVSVERQTKRQLCLTYKFICAISGYMTPSVLSLPWSLISVAVATKKQLCYHILLSWALSIPGRGKKWFLQYMSGFSESSTAVLILLDSFQVRNRCFMYFNSVITSLYNEIPWQW